MAERPDRSRAWAVLAVTLALMALVAAVSSATSRTRVTPVAENAAHRLENGAARANSGGASASRPGTKGLRHGAADQPAGSLGSRAHPRAAHGPALSSTGVEGTPGGAGDGSSLALPTAPVVGTVTHLDSGIPTGGSGTLGEPLSTQPAPSTTPSRSPVSSGTATGGPSTSTVATGSASVPPSTAAASRSGAIGPTGTASFPAAGGGPISAEATWTGAPALELAVTCPSGVSAARTGASGLSIEVDDTHGSGACTVTLSLAPGENGEVEYHVTIEPAV